MLIKYYIAHIQKDVKLMITSMYDRLGEGIKVLAKVLFYDYLVKDNETYMLVASTEGLCYVGLKNQDELFWEKLKKKYYTNYRLQYQPKEMTIYKQALASYFDGEKRSINVPFSYQGTDFQKQVWQALKEIPYGSTTTYQEIAKQINRPTAVRAVANAIGNNPLLIAIPCHRVLGKNGSITGFRAGIILKKQLLQIEEDKTA